MSMTRMVAGNCAIVLIALGAGTTYGQATSTGSGQDYPNKPVRIVTTPAGAGSDFASRLIAQGISGSLGQQVIVDNRGGIIPIEIVSKAPPDGYTVLFTGPSFWIMPLLQVTSYDPLRDFSPVVIATSSPNALAVHPSLPVKSVKELIALAKARPGELNYGAGRSGSNPHLAMELFKSMAGINMVYVPYNGTPAAVTALLSSEVKVMFPAAALVTPHLVSGKLKALAVTSTRPIALLPGVPTVAASGLPGFVVDSVDGLLAPAKTPAAIINRLNREIVRHLNTAEAKKRFLDTGVEVVGSTPEEFAATIKSETATWGKIIKDVGIKSN